MILKCAGCILRPFIASIKITSRPTEIKAINQSIKELKIVENFDIHESEEFEVDDDENTISILNRYIDESEFEFDKNIIPNDGQDISLAGRY